ncbi:hypothetical protein BJF83_08625 [Nocardiopsis sp. CNR-923]|uniref:hypothetical protein n=1 Tax=Nocardiopsis sp. CNR-923 TaxID=1904965 RepID=UPI000969723C|nr:hypothetical protein [Nocardiopsis sp. CNR-923]OLT30350.1 hypothetical protein BJF83_08625 [Nocardiopsis sp. CNR-923]
MEAIGVPWFIAVRHLGPPLFLLAVGGAVLARRRPARRALVWAALLTNLAAAALPYAWIGAQTLADQAERTVYGLVVTLLQPGLVVVAWLLLLAALVGPRRSGESGSGDEDSGTPAVAKRDAQNIG